MAMTTCFLVFVGAWGFEIGAREWRDDLENNRKIMNMALGILAVPILISLTKHNLFSLNNFKNHFPSELAPDKRSVVELHTACWF